MEHLFDQIGENNLSVLRRYHLESYTRASTLEESLRGGDLFMQKYLGIKKFNLFKNSADLDDKFEIVKEKELVGRILEHDICLITVRPEMTHYIKQIEGFLQRRGLSPIYKLKHQLSNEQYWDIYHRGITNPNARNFMATRTLVYTSSPVTTIIFQNSKPQRQIKSIDYVFNQMKGEAGRHIPNTLRGDLILNEAKHIGLDKIPMDESIGLAMDPFRVHRNLLKINPSHAQYLLEHLAVSVHIPNSSELARDLSVVLSSDELISVLNNIKHE